MPHSITITFSIVCKMAEAVAHDSFVKGCSHYKRRCRVLAPCCMNVYPCHVCHDSDQNHSFPRSKVTHHICVECNKIQNVGKFCEDCGILFGKYACLQCYMFDDNLKGQFHCESCGICRVGGYENFFHCRTCNMCISIRLLNNHTCLENCSEGDCPLCAEALHTTREELERLLCGHLIHKTCKMELIKENIMTCLVCTKKY